MDNTTMPETWERIMKSACPKCGARPDQRCKAPSGRRVYGTPPHAERREAAIRDGHHQP